MRPRVHAAHLAFLLRPTPLHRFFGPLLEWKAMRDWERTRQGPAPSSIKQRMVSDYARTFAVRVFIETGTFFGDMIEAVRREFTEVHSVELDAKLHHRARRRFAGVPNVHLHRGDSGRVLSALVERLEEPALFWLDAHWSAGVTAHGETATPIRQELAAILDHPIDRHIVLIDDARLFGVARDYPTLAELRAAVSRRRESWDVRVADDVIHVARRDRLLPWSHVPPVR
jgi:hypothetical protein